jgi:hypothetical protein
LLPFNQRKKNPFQNQLGRDEIGKRLAAGMQALAKNTLTALISSSRSSNGNEED